MIREKPIRDTGTDTIPLSDLDTDETLSANSDSKVPSQKATKTYVDNSLLNPSISKIFLDTNPTVGSHEDGKLYWDADNKCMAIEGAGNVTLQVGQEDHRLVYNTGTKISNGVVVYTNGVYTGGSNDTVTIAKAKADSAATSFVLGICTQDIENNSYGLVTLRGNVNDLDTQKIDSAYLISQGILYHSKIGGLTGNAYTVTVVNTGVGGLRYSETATDITIDLGGTAPTAAQVVALFTVTPSAIVSVRVITAGNVVVAGPTFLANGKVISEGDVLYLHPDIDGILTTIVPTSSDFKIRVGRLITLNTYGTNNGRINVRIDRSYRVSDLADTTITAPAAEDSMIYDGTAWVNKSSYSVTIGAGKTLNVTDGTLTLADNQISGDKVEGGTINDITINTLESTTITSKTIQAGEDGTTGVVKLYSEQGANDYIASLYPNSAMTENSSFYLPSSKPAATYIMVMTSAGVMGFDLNTYVALTGDQSINGIKTFGSFPITPSSNPTTPYQVANKSYVDSVAVGLIPKDACRLATADVLPACTYSGTPNFTLTGDAFGLLSIDGTEVIATNRVLIKNQADSKQNGIYTVTTIGDAGTAFVLTRATDYDSTSEVNRGTFTYITAGSTNAGYQFIQTTTSPTLDTDNLIFGILYAPLADTLDIVTNRGATTSNSLTMGGLVNTSGLTESGIVNTIITYSILPADRHIYCRPAAGDIDINLPAATGSGRIISISKRDSSGNSVTILGDSTGVQDLIDGKSSRVLGFQYERVTLQDNATNEWALIASCNITGNSYLVSTSGGDFETLKEGVDWFNANATDNTELVLAAENHQITATVTVNNPNYTLQIRGIGPDVSHLQAATGLTGNPMINITTNCDIRSITAQAETLALYGTLANENFITWDTNNLASGLIYTETTDIVVQNFKVGFSDRIGMDLFLFNFILDTCGIGVEKNYATIGITTTSADIEIGNFIHCPVGVALTKALKDNITLLNCIFKHELAEVGVSYDGTNYSFGEASAIITNITNNKGTFVSGFDFTIARDANMEIISNVGEEDKTPHAKINVVGNTTATPVVPSTWTKCTFVNTNSYTCKWTIANNRMTYLSSREHDIMMWISGNVYCGTYTVQNIQFGVVKNNTSTTIYGQMQVTTDASNRRFGFSMNVYLDDVVSGDYFELWVRNTTGTEDPTISDLTWLALST